MLTDPREHAGHVAVQQRAPAAQHGRERVALLARLPGEDADRGTGGHGAAGQPASDPERPRATPRWELTARLRETASTATVTMVAPSAA